MSEVRRRSLQLGVRLNQEESDMVDQLADRWGISRQDVVRRALEGCISECVWDEGYQAAVTYKLQYDTERLSARNNNRPPSWPKRPVNPYIVEGA